MQNVIMSNYVKVDSVEDDIMKLSLKFFNFIEVVNKKDIIVNSHDYYTYTGLTVNLLKPNVFGLLSPEIPSDFKYLIIGQDINKENNIISISIYNPSSDQIVIPAGTVLGNYWIVIPATLTEKEEKGYYISDYLFIKELKPKLIHDSKYVIDEHGNHKLEFRLNRALYLDEDNSEIPLKDLK